MSDYAVEQGRSMLAFLFKEKYLNLNVTSENRFINHRIEQLNKWQKEYLGPKIDETYEWAKKLKERRQPLDVLEALIMDKVFNSGDENTGTLNQSEIFEEYLIFFSR